jgi:hypothetical protein
VKVFGVGCFYFGYTGNSESAGFPSNRERFLNDVKLRLENVENVSSVTIHSIYDDNFLSSTSVKADGADIHVPLAHGARIEFDIFVPFRIQDVVHERGDVETVHIDIVWKYEMPIAFLSYEWPDEEGSASPSGSVATVFKYLEKKLNVNGFRFGRIGPSPFHADFAIIETQLNDGFKIDDVSIDRLGYASMEITAPPRSSVLDCAERTRLCDTLSHFYQLSEFRSRAIDEQTDIVVNSRGLLKQEETPSFWRKISRLRKRPKEIDALHNNVFQEMLVRLDMSSALSEAERYQLIGKDTPLDRFFDRYREMSIEQSWGKFSDVARFFEERHQKAVGNITAIFAGVIGGIIGSLIGSLATYVLTAA